LFVFIASQKRLAHYNICQNQIIIASAARLILTFSRGREVAKVVGYASDRENKSGMERAKTDTENGYLIYVRLKLE
jgi:hypothetical protein